MSLVHKLTIADYFSTHPVLYSSFPQQIGICKGRFFSILKYLHINDSYIRRGEPNHHQLHKICPMVNRLNEKFKILYTSETITVDEAMIPFKGRLAFRVYIQNKPNKYGVRLEVVANAANSVVLHFEAYTWSAEIESNTVNDLVWQLLSPVENRHYKISWTGDIHHQLFMKSWKFMPKAFKANLKNREVMRKQKKPPCHQMER